MARLRVLLLFVLLLGLSGCGYHVAGSATHVPASVRTLAVPVFATRGQQYRTETICTEAVVHELNTRTRYRIVNSDDADKSDATLQGTILSQNVAPLTYDASSGATSSYLITVQAKVALVARDGHLLYSNDRFLFREQFQSTQDLSAFIQEDGPAMKRIGRDFAQAVVSDLLNSF